MNTKVIKPLGIVIAVVVMLLAGAVFFLASQVASRPDDARVIALIDERLGQQKADTPATDTPLTPNEKEIVAIVDKRLRQRGAGGLSEEEFNARVERGIVAIVEKRRRAEESRPQQLAKNVPPPTKDDHVYGNRNAPVSLIEYSDFECPFCKSFHPTVKKVVDESNGQVKWVYRHFPLDQLHPVKARKEAAASECANELGGNEAFWKFTDRFFELTPSNNRTDIETVLPQIAREIGLNEKEFAACLKSGKYDKHIEEDYQSAVASGGNGTPWSIVVSKSGKKYPLSGAQPMTAIKQLVKLALQEK